MRTFAAACAPNLPVRQSADESLSMGCVLGRLAAVAGPDRPDGS